MGARRKKQLTIETNELEESSRLILTPLSTPLPERFTRAVEIEEGGEEVVLIQPIFSPTPQRCRTPSCVTPRKCSSSFTSTLMGQRDLNPQRHAEFQMSVEAQENFRESSRSLKPVIAVKMNVLEEMLMNCYTSPEFCYHKAIVEVSSRQIKESLEMVMGFFFCKLV